MKKIVLGAMVLLASYSASAVNLAFKFEVTSSGNSMYACNAGLKHEDPAGRVCYNRTNLQSCNPTNVCTDGQDCDCVCTGGGLGATGIDHAGEYRLDYMTASYANWSENGELPTGSESKKYTAGQSDFRKLFDDSTKFSKQLTSLAFFLGSERYNAEYFVDVCFRATQISYNPNQFNNSDYLNWNIKAGVTVTDIGSTQNPDTNVWDLDAGTVWYKSATYQSLSGLKATATVLCKSKTGETLTLGSSETSFTNAQLVQLINQNTTLDLKGCYVRYSFRETNSSGIQSVRKWKKQQAKICTYTSINEPSEE